MSVLQGDKDQRSCLTSWRPTERNPLPSHPCLFFFKCLQRKQVPGVFWKRLFPVESRDQTGTVLNQIFLRCWHWHFKFDSYTPTAHKHSHRPDETVCARHRHKHTVWIDKVDKHVCRFLYRQAQEPDGLTHVCKDLQPYVAVFSVLIRMPNCSTPYTNILSIGYWSTVTNQVHISTVIWMTSTTQVQWAKIIKLFCFLFWKINVNKGKWR